MTKPPEILELERELEIELEEVENSEFFFNSEKIHTYICDEDGEIMGLNLSSLNLNNIFFLEKFNKLIALILNRNKIEDISLLKNFTDLHVLIMNINEIRDISALRGLENIRALGLAGNMIQDIDPLKALKKLQVLNLNDNQIQNISVLGKLTNLSVLELRKNPIPDFTPLRTLMHLQKPFQILELENRLNVEFQKATSLKEIVDQKFLDYSSDNNLMYYLNKKREIIGLRLVEIRLDNYFFISHFKNLRALNLAETGIKDISFLNRLGKLHSLDLFGNTIEDISPISELQNLKVLNLSSYGTIENINPLKTLNELEILNLWNCRIKDLRPLESLSKLRILSLGKNHDLEDISSLSKIKNLEELNLSYNKIINIAPLKELKKLKILDLAGNNLQNLKFLSVLKGLQKIDLSWNKIQDVSLLTKLDKLQFFDVSNNEISKISFSFFEKLVALKELHLYRNPIKNIPKEIFDKRGNVLIPVRTYLQDLAHGASANNDVKLLLLGNGGVGKTQIAKRLAERERFVFNAQHDSTHGIVLLQRTLENLNLNIWDFAGQDIYHATHRLFMQTRALFVLVWDMASETSAYHEHEGRRYKNEKLQYWLEYTRCFAPESPILVVQNKVDTPDATEQTYLEQTLEYYKAHYPIIEFVQVSAQTGYNFDVLEYWLAESFRQDEQLKQQLLIDIPTSWAQVRARIRVKQAEQEKTLSVEAFKTLCADEGIPDSWHTLLQYLHDTSVLYYREGYFDNQIILDQAWAIDAVYAVLNRQSFYFRTGKIKKGRLQYADLQALWKNNTDTERALFIDFMLSTELCFETTEHKSYDTPLSERTFVVPQLLPEDKPKAVEFEAQERNICQISEIVQYRFLPSVFIQRFIIKASVFSKVEMMWQHGILLQWQEHYAVIEANYDTKQLLIYATGAFLLQKIKEELELIAHEGKIRAAKPGDGEDPILRGERFLDHSKNQLGLKGLIRIFDNKINRPMYGIEQEIEGLQNALHILIEKKNFFLEEQSTALDAEVKFSLKRKLQKLEAEIDAYRQKLQQLAAQAPHNTAIQQLQQEATDLKQIIIQKAEKIYNIGNIDNATFS